MMFNDVAFRSYLEHIISLRGPYAPVGISQTPCDCPLAKFIRYQGGNSVEVSTSQIQYWKEDERYEFDTPPWAKKFIVEVDRMGMTTITAKVAHTILSTD